MVNQKITKIYQLNLTELLIINDDSQGDYQKDNSGAAEGGNRLQSRRLSNKSKILIVDDEEIILEMYKVKLQKEGYKVLTASDVKEGLRMARQEKPEIILTSIVMPKYDDFYLLETIKNDSRLKDIPVIALSNFDDSEKKQEAYALGTLYFFVKFDFLPKDVARVVKEILSIKNKNI